MRWLSAPPSMTAGGLRLPSRAARPYQRAMDDRSDRAAALVAEGEALVRAWRLNEAEALLLEAGAIAPTFGGLQALGHLRQLFGDFEAAEAWFRRALALDPGSALARASLGTALLGQGRWAEGFAEHDAWRRVADDELDPAPELGLPLWSGEPLAGKNVLVWGEEGLGDQIMHARFAPLLRDAGAEVTWVCPPALRRLVSEGLGMTAIPRGGTLEIAGADYLAPSSRLPATFMGTMAQPPPAPYLAPPRPNRAPGLTLGVMARGNPIHDNDRNRSLTPEAAAALMALPGAVSLAPEETGARDFWDTAGIVMGLELVITVDTSVGHLAGALGKPVWTLLPAIGSDWRWLRNRSDSPWYGSMRLFRQRAPGDWLGVIAEVKAALG